MSSRRAPTVLRTALALSSCLAAAAFAASPLQPTLAPNAPRGLVAQAVRADAIVLLWRDTSNNETGFVVQGRLAEDPVYTTLDTLPANTTSYFLPGLVSSAEYAFRVLSINAGGTSGSSGSANATTLASDACVASATVMCLNGNRFRVQALFLTAVAGNGDPSQAGEAHTVKLTADSGYLWFFGSSNIEAVVKVIDGCGLNTRYWVFAGGLTDVRVLLTVTDTELGVSRSFSNPLGVPFRPVQDTSAFATCVA